ncbi:MAG: hypothetical protein WCB96_05725 [Candidatus Aminicenantales bacterium]
MSKTLRLGFLLLALAASPLAASSYLFYLEAQGLAGYSSATHKAVFYSSSPEEAMQKPSLGFDYVQRFSDEYGDTGVLSLQFRLTANIEGGPTLEPQVYNGFLKLKLGLLDLWAGHNRPRFGLSADMDNHGLLLQALSMNGFGFDRDWGVGLEKDLAWGQAGLSLTSGSGMALYLKGNYFMAARVSLGILARDNLSLGFSAGFGKLLDVMGINLLSERPRPLAAAGVDFTRFWNNLESRLEFMAGRLAGQPAYALFWRVGAGFLEENRLKLEVQPIVFRKEGLTRVLLSAGASFPIAEDWTLRGMVQYDRESKEVLFVLQVYFYKGLRF